MVARSRGSKSPAVVVGDMDLVRAVGLAGMRPTLAAPADEPGRYSRFVSGWIDATRADLVDALVAHADESPEPPLLFLQTDRALQLVSDARTRLLPAYRVRLPNAGMLGELLDKSRFGALAGRLDLPVPASRRVRPGIDPGLGDLRLPLVVKPLVRDRRWFDAVGWHKALRVEDAAGWERVRPRLAALDLVVQELVPGGEERIESHHAYIGAGGEVLGEFTGRKLRTRPAEFGMSTALITTANADVRALGRDVLDSLGIAGPVKLDFKRDPDGRLWLLEVNPRFTLWAHLGALAGVNIPALAAADLAGRPAAAGAARPGVRWCELRQDAAAVREAGGSLGRWAGFALRAEARSAIHLDDPMPTLRGKLWPRIAGRGAR